MATSDPGVPLTGHRRSRHNLQVSLQVLQDLGLGTLRIPPKQLIQSLQLAGWGKYGGHLEAPVAVGEYGGHVWAPIAE